MRKTHKYINPRTGLPVCEVFIEPDERYRWEPYQNTFWKMAKKDNRCKRCLKARKK